jgi:hypothetical protein
MVPMRLYFGTAAEIRQPPAKPGSSAAIAWIESH